MAQLVLQELYHPERIDFPLKRVGKKGSSKFEAVSFDEVLKDIATKIDNLRKDGKANKIAAISASHTILSNMLLDRFLMSLGSLNSYVEPSIDTLTNAAVNLTQGINGSISYDFENSDFILSFGARLLEGWGETSTIHRAFANWKRRGVKLFQIDSLCTRTASIADKWIPIKPGTESIFALGIAYHLIKMGKRSKGVNFGDWSQVIINQYTPERVSTITGVASEVISNIAKEFASAKKPLAVSGKGAMGVSSSVAEIVAVQSLNSLMNNLGKKGGVFVKTCPGLGKPKLDSIASAAIQNVKPAKGVDDFIKNFENIEILFINGANPVHRSVYGKLLAKKMKKIPMVVSIMPLINDTANYSDYILPSLTCLEMTTVIGDEAVSTRNKSMHPGDIILKIAKGIEGVSNSFPWSSYKDVIKLASNVEIKPVIDFSFTTKLFKSHLTEVSKRINTTSSKYPLILLPYELSTVGDGNGLAFPYVLKGIDAKILTGDTLWVDMNPVTAKKHGVSEGSCIDIISEKGKIGCVKIHLTKTVATDVIAVPLGFGHTSYTKYGSCKGINPKEIMSDSIDPISGIADWWFTRIKIS